MRPFAMSTVTIDLIYTREELGELVKLGSFLARDITVTASKDEPEGFGKTKVTLRSRDQMWLEVEIGALVALCGVLRDKTVDEVFEETKHRLKEWGYPTEGKPSDGLPFGSGLTNPEADPD